MVDQHDADGESAEDIDVSERVKQQAAVTGADPQRLQFAMDVNDEHMSSYG